MANIIEHRKFICVCFENTNNNKAWQITLYDNDDVLVEWGRVGKALQSKLHSSVGRRKFERLINDKTSKSNSPDKLYTEVKAIDSNNSTISKSSSIKNVDLKEIAKKQIKYNSPILANFIEWLTEINAHNILVATGGSVQYNVDSGQFKTPMGIIAPEQVKEARNVLFNLAKDVTNKNYDDNFNYNLNHYLRLIPHDFGMRKINPLTFLPDMNSVQKENDILDGLDASFNDALKPKDNNSITKTEEKVFDTELNLVTDRDIIERINKKYETTKKGNHSCSHLKLKCVYSVLIKSTKDKFDKVSHVVGNIHELFHGTSSQNLLSVLKSGLKVIPPSTAYISGKMFGNGTYASPCSSKALNYSFGYWNNTRHNRCFMFLVDFCCGKVYVPRSSNETFPKKGYDSTWAKQNISGVINDEVIVYKDEQCNPTYLLEFNI